MAIKYIRYLVDNQNDFMNPRGALYVAGADVLIARVQHYLENMTVDDTECVVFSFDTHLEDIYKVSEEAKQFNIHCERGTWGWELVVPTSRVPQGIKVYVIEKGVFDVWQENGLKVVDTATGAQMDRDEFFAKLKADAEARGDELVIEASGVAADFCVKWFVDGAVVRGFKVVIRKDLVAGIVRQIEQVVEEDFAGKDVTIVDGGLADVVDSTPKGPVDVMVEPIPAVVIPEPQVCIGPGFDRPFDRSGTN